MCLAIPARILSVDEFHIAQADIMGVTRRVSLDLVPEAGPGDHVLIHAGFAIQVIDEADAKETLDLLFQMDMFREDAPGTEEFVEAAAPEASTLGSVVAEEA